MTEPELVRLIEANAESVVVTLGSEPSRRLYVVDAEKLAKLVLASAVSSMEEK